MNSANNTRIVIVEDQEDSRVALEFFLEMHGFQVIGAESAEEGRRAVERDRPELIITDFSLPSGTGVWMLEQLIESGAFPPCGAIIVTGHPDVKGPPGVDVMMKPVDLDVLLRRVHEKLGTHARASAPPARTEPLAEASDARVHMTLYVTRDSLASLRAQRNLVRLLQGYDPAGYRLDVLDVADEPDAAARDHVHFTPALVKRSPAPRAWLLGDFADPRPLDDLLSAHGLERNS